MAHYFNKTITTPEAQALYDRIQECEAKLDELYAKKSEAHKECDRFEGKYAIGKIDNPFYGMGQRSWVYQYASPEDEQRERIEAAQFRREKIEPLCEQIDDLRHQIKELEEQLCIALWGYGTEAFSLVNAIGSLEKDIAKKMRDIKRLNALIEEHKKELQKIGVEV